MNGELQVTCGWKSQAPILDVSATAGRCQGDAGRRVDVC